MKDMKCYGAEPNLPMPGIGSFLWRKITVFPLSLAPTWSLGELHHLSHLPSLLDLLHWHRFDQSAAEVILTYLASVSQAFNSSWECMFVGCSVLVWRFICPMQITIALNIAIVPTKRWWHCMNGSQGLKFRGISIENDDLKKRVFISVLLFPQQRILQQISINLCI